MFLFSGAAFNAPHHNNAGPSTSRRQVDVALAGSARPCRPTTRLAMRDCDTTQQLGRPGAEAAVCTAAGASVREAVSPAPLLARPNGRRAGVMANGSRCRHQRRAKQTRFPLPAVPE